MSGALAGAAVIAGTELRRFARDRTALLFVLVLPVAVIIVIGSTFSAAPVSLPVGIVVDGEAASVERVVDALEGAGTIEAERYDDRASLDVAIRTGALSGGVVVGDDRLTTVIDLADQNAPAVRSAIQGALVHLGTVDAVAEALAVAPSVVEQAGDALAPVAVERREVDDGLGHATSQFAYTAPSNLVLFTFINSLTAGAVLVEARRNGITQRWAASPLPTGAVVAGVLASRLALALAQAVIIVGLGAGLFDVAWGDPIAVTALVVAFAVVATGAGVLLGTFARTADQTIAVAIPVAIGMAMLGGCMWPLEIVGDTMRAVGHLTPHAWAMDAFISLVFDDAGLADVGTELGVLAALAGALTTAAALRLRRGLL